MDGQTVHCWVCTDTWLCVCSGEQGFVCVCLFALECLRICVSCIWLCSLCVLTHVCLYVPCWYRAAKAKLSKPKPDSLHSTLCAILLFYVSVVVEKEKFAWLSTTFVPSYYLGKIFISISVLRPATPVAQARELHPFICGHASVARHLRACVYMHRSSKNTQSQQFSILFLPRTSFWKLSSLNCCPLSFIACHTLWHLAAVLPRSPQTKSRSSFRVSASVTDNSEMSPE